jgi:precorrin-3B C17-methyltransferase
MTGRLWIVGLGPGAEGMQTPQAIEALAAATDLVGYATYLPRVPARARQQRHASDNRAELHRAQAALELAAQGHHVAIVSSGDPGVFAMASAVVEAPESGPDAWRRLDIEVVPGISAMFAAAARIGAPLGHDFRVLSLSGNLKPWPLVLHRLVAAASAGFVLALYNVASRARPWQHWAALDALRPVLPPTTPVVFATAVSRADEAINVTNLAAADPARADMRTPVLVGSAATRLVARPGARPWLYTPRAAEVAA